MVKIPTNKEENGTQGNKNKVTFKALFILTLIISFILASLISYIDFDINRQAEYCQYVDEGDIYHLHHSGMPCVLQWKLLITFLKQLLLWMLFLQGPVWLFYFKAKS